MKAPSILALAIALVPVMQGPALASGWSSLDSGTNTELLSVHFTSEETGYAVGRSGTGLTTSDAGLTWQAMSLGVGVDLYDIAFVGEVGVAVGTAGTIVRTTNSGSTWSLIPSGIADPIFSIALAGSNGICGAASQTILHTTDLGASWMISQDDFFGGGFYGADMVGPDIAFVGGQNSIFAPLVGRSTDGGANWEFSTFYLNSNEGSTARIDFTDSLHGYAVSHVWDGRGAISRTSDGGETWSTTLFAGDLHGISFPNSNAGQTGFVVGSEGLIYRTSNAAMTWELQESGTSLTLRDVFFLDADVGYVVGSGGTILRTTTGGDLPGSVEAPGSAGQEGLVRVFPNPSRDLTTFALRVPGGGTADLVIYDSGGRSVRTLIRGKMSSGVQLLNWDGRDDSGQRLRSGLYRYRFVLGSRIETGSVALIH